MKTLLFLLLALPAFGQTPAQMPLIVNTPTYINVANENDTITAAQVSIYRFGAASGVTNTGVDCSKTSCWIPYTPTAALSNFTITYSLFPSDPAPYVSKEFDVLQTASVQTFTVTPYGTTASVTVTVPALAAPPPPVTPPPATATPVGPPVPAMAQLMSDGTYVVTLNAKATVNQ